MKPKFYGKIKNGKFSLNKGQPFDAYVAGQSDGNYHISIHKTKGPPKTLPQLGYYYAVIVPHALKAMKEHGWDTYTIQIAGNTKELPMCKEVVDYILKDACAWEEKSKANMDKQECSRFIDRCIQWCARYLGCVIPSPPDKDTVIPRKEARMA